MTDSLSKIVEEMRDRANEDTRVTVMVHMPQWASRIEALAARSDREREFLEAVRALLAMYGEHVGYVAEYQYEDLALLDDWYCMGTRCGQPFGKPHLDGCEVAAYRALVEAEKGEG